jgi:3' terminal RNA ribose 2'-O-methyltransferase Hen1
MLLTITTTHRPATDLGYLLHKNPAKVHSFELSFGKAHLFYPEATEDRCTAALLLDVDPVGLVRGKGQRGEGATLDQYVNDRPYVLSSFTSVAIGRALGTAMTGRSKGRQELAERKIPLTAILHVIACRGGDGLLRELFEPLGYRVRAERHPLDETFPEWGDGPYYTVTLEGEVLLRDLLRHLYVLIPVLDAEKHYWVGKDEVEKLLRRSRSGASPGGSKSRWTVEKAWWSSQRSSLRRDTRDWRSRRSRFADASICASSMGLSMCLATTSSGCAGGD